MPPKKEKTESLDGVDTSPFSKDQVNEFALKLVEAKNNEKTQRANFKMERDKIMEFWGITRVELEKVRAEINIKERQIEQAENANQEELKLYKEKVKHLQLEHQKGLTECKTETLEALRQVQADYSVQQRQITRDNISLESQLKEKELDVKDQMKALKLLNSEEIDKARSEFEAIAKEMDQKYEKKLIKVRTDLTLKYEDEIELVETRKNERISRLIQQHDKNFDEMKNYYNDITLNNLTLISVLKEEMEELKMCNERMAKQVSDLTENLKQVTEPLVAADKEIENFKIKLHNYNDDMILLASSKAQLAELTKEYKELLLLYDALELRYETLEKEKGILQVRFNQATLEVQRKAGVKNLLLSKRLDTLNRIAEHSEVFIAELRNAPLQVPLKNNRKLEELLAKKDSLIDDLQYELARVSKAHDDLLSIYEDKLIQFGIRREELGFLPLRITSSQSIKKK